MEGLRELRLRSRVGSVGMGRVDEELRRPRHHHVGAIAQVAAHFGPGLRVRQRRAQGVQLLELCLDGGAHEALTAART